MSDLFLFQNIPVFREKGCGFIGEDADLLEKKTPVFLVSWKGLLGVDCRR